MTELVSGERLTCSLSGRRSYDRMIGECRLPDGRSLSRVMVREGYCSRW
jgi:endonuclease YncB( thermonuclease family)